MIYVSYSREDLNSVYPICKHLLSEGVKLFMDINQASGGGYAQELIKRIESAEAILLFYSNNVENSTWVKHEIEFALSKNKRVIPVLLSEMTDSGWYQYYIGKYQYIQFRHNPYQCAKEIAKSLSEEWVDNPNNKENYTKWGSEEGTSAIQTSPKHEVNSASPQNNSLLKWIGGFCVILVLVLIGVCLWPIKPSPHNENISPIVGCDNTLDSTKLEKQKMSADSIYMEYKKKEDSIRKEAELNTPTGPGYGYVVPEDSNTIVEEPISGPQEDSKREPPQALNITWLYVLIPVFIIGCGLLVVFLRKRKISGRENVKMSSDIASRVSIDGSFCKVILPREVYATHLEKGEYLIDFEDKNRAGRHKTFNHAVNSDDCKVLFANFNEESLQEGRTIKCFIAGSKSLQSERDALRAVTCVMYNKWESKNFRILSYTFEDFEKTAVVGGHQKQYNKFIVEEADWALFVIDGEVGGITVEEYQKAMDAYKKNGKPKILVLAKEGSKDNEEVAAIKSEINKEHQYWADYKDITSMKQTFESTLNWYLIDIYL